MSLLPVADALARILEDATPSGSETVPIGEAAGRVLAGPITALRTQPPFDASAMDGYAVRGTDVANAPARLTVIGQAPAGKPFEGRIGPGQAVRIFTGAPLPDGADTVVIQENVTIEPSAGIVIEEPTAIGRHVRRSGLDFRTGDALLERGRVLDAAALSLAASANHATLDVFRRPLVAILATGNELLPPGSKLGPGQIIASNAYGVAAISKAAGARALDLGIARDTPEAISEALDRAEAAGADVIVTLGGASVGDHDLVHSTLTNRGVDFGFWKIAMRPGKPLMFGRRGPQRFLGLPGNPVASLVCSHLFLKPLLARLGGLPVSDALQPARLGAPMATNDQRQDYVRATLERHDDGLVATPFDIQDSSMLRLLAQSGALIVRRPNAPAAEAGAPCEVLIL